jgi:hypothetical protein
MRGAFTFFAAAAAASTSSFSSSLAAGRTLTLSNTQLPVDDRGLPILTGEMSVVLDPSSNATHPFWVVYSNVWGGCPGDDCCTMGDCATCCFNPPSHRFPDACVYTNNHTVVAYRTDWESWTYLGEALPLSARLPGIEFRPQVIFHAPTNRFLMYYEDRWTGQAGYALAASPTPGGPFTTIADTIKLPGAGRVGDYDVFIDDDGTAYHVRTGLTIVKLNASWTGPTDEYVDIPNGGVEGPAMFKKDGKYFVLVGPGCCACRGGSDVIVYTSSNPLGPYELVGSVGKNTTAPFNAASPYNYVTRAQQTKVILVPDGAGNVQYLWMGNAWVTAPGPLPGGVGGPRDQDLLYFSVLQFNATGDGILQMVREDECQLQVPWS